MIASTIENCYTAQNSFNGPVTAICILLVTYITYQRCIHPLSSYPGPFMASVTNFWRFYHELRGDLPSVLHSCHKRYGSFVRVAPNEVDSDIAAAIEIVYKQGGRHYLKSDFYNGFTAVRPNVFGTRDEGLHALRRRQMAHAFSQKSLVKMEYIFDRHTTALLDKLDLRAQEQSQFHMEDILRFYSQDCNGDLSLGIQFATQKQDNAALLPPLNDHIALAKLTGYVPWIKPWFDRYGRYIPWPYLQQLLRSRAWMREEAVRVTDLEFARTGRDRGILPRSDDDRVPDKINLFTSLVRAKDPETGDLVERDDIISNAITFLTAGSHSTSSTLEIMWWYLTHFPELLAEVQSEIDEKVGCDTTGNHDLLRYEGLEAQLPLTSAFFLECFRLAPTFQHPAPRITPVDRRSSRYPTIIAGRVIPPGYAVSASILSLHRNPEIWGSDADGFRPSRWFEEDIKVKAGLLGHFGWGHRACIGRNQSLIMLWKAMVETLRRFDIVLADAAEQQQKVIQLRVTGFAELAKPLVVRVSRRKNPAAGTGSTLVNRHARLQFRE